MKWFRIREAALRETQEASSFVFYSLSYYKIPTLDTQDYREWMIFFVSVQWSCICIPIFVEGMHLCSEGKNCIWETVVTLQNSICPHVWSSPGPFHRSWLMSGPPENTEMLWPALTLSACHHDIRCLCHHYIMVWKGCPWMGASVLLSCHCPFQKQDIAAWLQFYPGCLAPFGDHILWGAESVIFFIYF